MKICVLQPSYEGSSCDYQHYDPPRDLSHLLPGARVPSRVPEEGLDVPPDQGAGPAGLRRLREPVRGLPRLGRAVDRRHPRARAPEPAVHRPDQRALRPAEGPDEAGRAVVAASTVPGVRRRGIGRGVPWRGRRSCVSRCSSSPRPTATAWASTSTRCVTTSTSSNARSTALLPRVRAACWSRSTSTAGSSPCWSTRAPTRASAPVALTPLEFLFPAGPHFKTYDLKVTQFHPECNVPCADPELADAAARRGRRQVFVGVLRRGVRPAGLPGRRRRPHLLPRGEFHLLGLLPGQATRARRTTSSRFDGMGQAGFLRAIIDEGTGPPRAAAAGVRRQAAATAASRCSRRAALAKRRRRLRGRGAAAAHRHRARTSSGRGPRRIARCSTATRTRSAPTSSCCGTWSRLGGRRRTTRATRTPAFEGLDLVAAARHRAPARN